MNARQAWLVTGALAVALAVLGTWSVAAGDSATRGDAIVDTTVEAWPESARTSAKALSDELDRRVAEWSEREGVNQMSTQDNVRAMDSLTNAITNRDNSPDWWILVSELSAKRGQLCIRLPQGHPYGEGEFC